MGLLDEDGAVATERLALLSISTESGGGLGVAPQKSFGQHVKKAQRLACTNEGDLDAMGFKEICESCGRLYPYKRSLETYLCSHC